MTRTRSTGTLVVALLVVAAFTAAPMGVAAQDGGPPAAPASYYGDVTLDGEPAPAGVEIVAYVDGEERGSYLTEQEGTYGASSALEANLVVEGDTSDEGELVEFTVNGHPADATVEWEPGTVENVDLSASLSGDPPDDGDDGDGADGGDGADDGDDGQVDDGDDGGSVGGVQPGGTQQTDAGTERVEATVQPSDDEEWTVSASADAVDADATVDADLGDAIATDDASVDGVSVTVAEAVDEFGISVRQVEPDALSDETGELEDADALSYLEFKPEGFESETVAESEFRFTVAESSLPDDASPEHVSLYRFDDGWSSVPTAYNGDGEYVATADGFSTFAIGAAEAGVSVTTVSLEHAEIEPGELAAVSATVENTGEVEETASVALRVDGETVDERRVTVDAGETRDVTFTPQFDAAGEYSIAVGDEAAGELTVVSQESDPAADDSSADAGTFDEPFGLDPIVAGATLVLVLALLGVLAFRRR